ncbi:YIP1 family protein [Bacillus safensis]|uniref:Yip1 family protein n=1 Tax=Bacillus TaxID=1386 RepID=UPI0007DC1F04|nr:MULTISPECIES: Yip1 family protein [Bacillus]MBW4849586.1 YIP1 family protein [Bacillaceae bacterium]MBW4852196.1 YIP1 family protein [Bacillaceae bacterium]MBW4856437.1 YIP1 family protein [Bacillaceae bacterium]MCY7584793.1 YIP1 family protein [Bacillus safensis]MCY7588920.1 YIP1 family protein [Bacillus safensis]
MKKKVNEIERTQKPSLLKMITNPTVQLNEIRKRPTVWWPLNIIIILNLVSLYFRISYSDNKTKEIEELIPFMVLVLAGLIIFIFIAPAIMYFISKIFKGQSNYHQMLSMFIYISLIGVIGDIVNTIIIIVFQTSPYMQITSLSSFINSSPPIENLLKKIELFTIWSFVLFAIGFQQVSGLSKKASWISSLLLFAIFTLFEWMLSSQ